MHHRRLIVGGLLATSSLCVSGCATVPKEAVALSVAVGEDIQQLYTGYRNTVKFGFEQMRQNGLTVIDVVWTPVYLRTFVKTGELIDIAKEENWEDLEGWARAAIEDIDAKRSEFLDSLQTKETALLNKIDEAFARTISANAAVTAHLNSVLKVQSLEDQVLDAVGLKDLRDAITNDVAEASNFVAAATEKIKGAAAALASGGDIPG